MNQTTASLQPGVATTVKKLFSRQTSIEIDINANPEDIWALLTNAADYTSWNSTVLEINGNIAVGEKIQLRSSLAPERIFKLKVQDFEPNRRLVWGDAMGKRTYSLAASDGSTKFHMTEKIGGPIFPLFARMIPSFDESFTQFASDLKSAAEGKS